MYCSLGIGVFMKLGLSLVGLTLGGSKLDGKSELVSSN